MNEDEWSGDENGDEIPCPYCKRPIHEESQRCPHCGNYITEEDAAPARKPWWIVVGTLFLFYVVYRWIAG